MFSPIIVQKMIKVSKGLKLYCLSVLTLFTFFHNSRSILKRFIFSWFVNKTFLDPISLKTSSHSGRRDDNSFLLLQFVTKKWNIFSSLFQYSERTINSNKTNNTSKKSSKPQHFLVLEAYRRGIIRRVPRPLALKTYFIFLQ